MDEQQLAEVLKQMEGVEPPDCFLAPHHMRKDVEKWLKRDQEFNEIFTPTGLMRLFNPAKNPAK